MTDRYLVSPGRIIEVPEGANPVEDGIRTFSTGANRDGDKDKIDFEGFLSPLVLLKYGEYMHKNRKMKDGSLRDSDNWKKHFGEKHYDVCIKSLLRHVHDLWMEHEGLPSREGIEDAMMGVMFNIMAYADKYYKDQLDKCDKE
jgi:hypothetical protein